MSLAEAEEALGEIRQGIVAAVEGFLATFRSRQPDETIYGLLLITSPEGCYVLVTAGTEEALTRTAVDYVSKGYRASNGDAIDLLRAGLRWNPEDGWYGFQDPCCDWVNQMISRAFDRGIIGYFDGTVTRLGLEALAILDASGAFGAGAERERIVIGLSCGSQSDGEYLARAKPANPAAVCDRLGAELAAGHAAWDRLISPRLNS